MRFSNPCVAFLLNVHIVSMSLHLHYLLCPLTLFVKITLKLTTKSVLPVVWYLQVHVLIFSCVVFTIRYGLAKDIDGQLKQMVGDLKAIIDHLNAAGTTQQENNDPVGILLTKESFHIKRFHFSLLIVSIILLITFLYLILNHLKKSLTEEIA